MGDATDASAVAGPGTVPIPDHEPGPIPTAVSLLALGVLGGWFAKEWIASSVSAPSVAAEPAPMIADAGHAVQLPAPTAASGPPDIFLVTVGSLRADHLPVYGYGRQTAPWIAQVSQTAHLFLAASATSSWSLPSITSLMTGVMPSQHGLVQEGTVGQGALDVRTLSPDQPTLAERLKQAGYNTYAIVASPLFVSGTGLERGFDRYLATGFADAPTAQFAIERIAPEVKKSDRPVFVWIHYSDPRDPYRGNPMLLRNWEPGRPIDESAAIYARMNLPRLLCRRELSAPGPDLDHLQAMYDSEIRLVDQHVQLLYGDLGIDDTDVVVITGDHGESFRDHGELGHRRDLYEESIQVPLVVSRPALWPEPRRSRNRVSLVDLVPTLAEIAGVPVPEGELPAQSLVPLLEGREWTRAVPVGAELLRADGERHRVVYDLGHKLVVRGSEPPELYSLREDPNETVDLARTKANVVQQLQGRLDAVTGGIAARPPVRQTLEIPPMAVEQLGNLGYETPVCR